MTTSTNYYIIIGMDKNMAVKSKNLEKELQVFKDICRKHGLKITPQRVAIYRELILSKKHPSAIMVYKKIKEYFPNISLGTVNSTLLTYARKGIVKIVESSGDPKRFDPKIEPHHHFRCMECGEIFDFHNDDYDAIKIPAAIKNKYVVLSKIVHLEGLCDKCKTKVNK